MIDNQYVGFFKKKLIDKPFLERRKMIAREQGGLSISRQCKLLEVCRSSLYIKPKITSELNLELMREMDEHYLEYPFKGAPRIQLSDGKDLGYEVSQNRVDRLYIIR